MSDEAIRAAQVLHGDLFRRLDLAIAAGRRDGLTWPRWVHAPLAASYAALADPRSGRVSSEHAKSIDRCAAIGAWRPTKGVYRFEPALLDALWSAPIAPEVPASILHRLPEWCVYLELEGKSVADLPIRGAYVHLECNADDGHEELRVLLNCMEPAGVWARLQPVVVPLEGTLAASLDAGLDASLGAGLDAGPDLAHALVPIVSCALHLCGPAPKLRDEAGRRAKPTLPLIDPKRGAAPGAQRATTWIVG